MSTPGKVLIVVVILALFGWIFLFAQIAQLNTNWGKKIDQLSEQVVTLEQGVQETRLKVETTLAEVTRSQNQRDRALTVLRARLSDVEKLQAINQEAADRVALQIAMLETANTQAQKALADRLQEKRQTNEAIAQTRSEVGVLTQQVTQRMDQLLNLRQEFVATHAENLKLLDQLKQAGTSTARGPSPVRVRPASLISR